MSIIVVGASTRSASALGLAIAATSISPFLRVIALSLRPSAARSSSSCKVKVTSDVLCYNRWDALRQVQCLDESGRDTRLAKSACITDCAACDIRPVKKFMNWVLNLLEQSHKADS